MVPALLASTAVAKDVPTTCQDLCSTYTSTLCVITAIHDVVAGSVVDCTSARDIQIAGGELRIHDAQFVLRGKSLLLSSGGKITADCPQSFARIGFTVDVVNAINQPANGNGKLTARCGVAGGRIQLTAGGAVTIAGLGIDANGTAPNAPGGTVRIASDSTVTISTDVTAEATGGKAPGGTILAEAAAGVPAVR
jgi:hypothetical protein